jgi:hypothetical protein
MRKKTLKKRLKSEGLNEQTANSVAGAFVDYGMEAVIEKYRPLIRKHVELGIEGNKELDLITICQLHRAIYRLLIKEGFEEETKLIKDLRKAYDIGKKMNAKLRQYKFGYDDNWYEENKSEGEKIDE